MQKNMTEAGVDVVMQVSIVQKESWTLLHKLIMFTVFVFIVKDPDIDVR